MIGGVCLLFLQDYSGHTQVSPQVTFWVRRNSPVQGPHLAGPTVHGEHAQTHILYRPTVIGIVCSLFSFLSSSFLGLSSGKILIVLVVSVRTSLAAS